MWYAAAEQARQMDSNGAQQCSFGMARAKAYSLLVRTEVRTDDLRKGHYELFTTLSTMGTMS